MKGGICQGFEPVCANFGKPKKMQRHTGIVALRLKGSLLFMCNPCKQARLTKYPQLVVHQSGKHSVYYDTTHEAQQSLSA